MKKVFFAALIPAALLLSCADNKHDTDRAEGDTAILVEDTVSRMNSPVENKMSDTHASKTVSDKAVIDFVHNSTSVSAMEIELGNYAVQNAKSQRVKDFGSMMATDHTAAANELKSMASSNNITIPTAMNAEHQKHVDMCKQKKGGAFDKDYMDMMVKGHKETIDNFQKASKDLKEDSYKSFASKTLPVLQKHLDSAQAIRKSL